MRFAVRVSVAFATTTFLVTMLQHALDQQRTLGADLIPARWFILVIKVLRTVDPGLLAA